MDVVTLGLAQADARRRYSTKAALGASRRLLIGSTYGCADGTAQTGTGSYDTPIVIGADCADIAFVYGNFYTAQIGGIYGDYTPTTTVTIGGAALVIPGQGVYPVTFNGQVGGTVAPGGFLTSDHLPLNLARGTIVFLRTYVSAGTWYATHISGGQIGNGGSNASNLTLSTSTSTASQNAGAQYGPMGVLGTVADGTAAVLIQGDSIAHGYGDAGTFVGHDPNDVTRSGGGYLQRALVGKVGYANIAFPGDKAAQFAVPAGYLRRMFFARYATHAVVEYPRNDISDEVALATTQANLLKILLGDTRRGLKIVLTTCTPKTSSTDNWRTAAGQSPNTANAESIRVAYNTWLRDGAPMDAANALAALPTGTSSGTAVRIGATGHPVSAYWEITDLVETARNSGVWAPPDRTVPDAAITAGQSVLTSATAAFTAADVNKTVIVPGAGSSGGNYSSVIRSIISGTQAQMNGTAATTVTGATAAIGVKTDDGVHPNQGGALVAAAGVKVTDLT